jgi:hypothetical protein
MRGGREASLFSQSALKASEVKPEPSLTTYADAIERLNAKSLRHSLEVVCLLSCAEFMGGHRSPLFPLVNHEKVRLQADAVVKSRAAWYKERLIRPTDLPTLLKWGQQCSP